jgi:hypothetical protein
MPYQPLVGTGWPPCERLYTAESPPGHRRSSDATREPGSSRKNLCSTPLHASLEPGFGHAPAGLPGIPGLRRVEAEGTPPDGSPEQSHHKDTVSLDTERALRGGRSANRSQKEDSVSPPEPEPGDTRAGKLRVVKVWSARALLKGRAIQAHTNETAVSDCTSLAAAVPRTPGVPEMARSVNPEVRVTTDESGPTRSTSDRRITPPRSRGLRGPRAG